MTRSLPETYSPLQIALHWLTAITVLIMIPVGIVMQNLGDGALKNNLYELHKSFGLTILGLTLLRLLVRTVQGAPPLVAGLPGWQRLAAHASHAALYGLLLVVPLMGWTGVSACCAPVNWFWSVPLTLPIQADKETTERIFDIHEALALTLAAIVLIHASAALHHHYIRRDVTLRRMLPLAAPRSRTTAP